jgi:hypothetical protein
VGRNRVLVLVEFPCAVRNVGLQSPGTERANTAHPFRRAGRDCNRGLFSRGRPDRLSNRCGHMAVRAS